MLRPALSGRWGDRNPNKRSPCVSAGGTDPRELTVWELEARELKWRGSPEAVIRMEMDRALARRFRRIAAQPAAG